MARIEPLPSDAVGDLAPLLEQVREAMGFVPNSMLTMARVPGLAPALSALTRVIWGPGRVDPAIKGLAAIMASRGAECRYCQAHTAHRAHGQLGVEQAKLDALWSFETADLFSAAERAVLRVAFGAGQAPNGVTDADFAALRTHFDDDQVAELVAMISLFGFLNRWNDTLATELEASPLAFGEASLTPLGWDAGKHGSGTPST
ncbi:MAG TPA: carboxymuconolactone decarboxylase family protein [Pseudomonadales bacterium]|nr:carboxymuconolactone decarboxylase family protein [Pseudomonadales bacterium]